ncbi:MAG: CHAD domain-containing protein [Gemmatimonadetes bacterium]|nr:CHAD domain-containing protein [Gemmatimonadota bacterium]
MTTIPTSLPACTPRRFRTDQLPEIRHLLHAHPQQGGLGVRAGDSSRVRETYVDTADARFLRAGYSLAIRNQGEGTDVVLDPWRAPNGRPSLHVRAPIPSAELDGFVENCPEGVRGTLQAVVGREPLCELLRLLVRRETYHLTREDEPLGSVTLVETLAYGDGATQPARHEHVEFELNEDEADPESFLAVLKQRFALRETDEPPVPELLRERTNGSAVAPKLGTVRFGPRSTVAETAYAILRRHFLRARAHEPGARLGVDPEELSEMRAALGRMRAALRLYRGYLPKKARRLRKDLVWITAHLGDVRDLDVQIGWLRSESARRPLGELRALRDIEAALRRRRAGARDEMLAALDSKRYAKFVRDCARWLRKGPDGKPKAGRKKIRKIAPDLVEAAMRRVEKRSVAVADDTGSESLRALRTEVKRARYALEFHRPVYGARARDVTDRIIALQELLGEYEDAQVFLARTARFFDESRQMAADDPLAALETLRQERMARAEELRGQLPRAVKKARGKPWKRLRKVMRKAMKKKRG